jgi:glyoxylate carboligase
MTKMKAVEAAVLVLEREGISVAFGVPALSAYLSNPGVSLVLATPEILMLSWMPITH